MSLSLILHRLTPDMRTHIPHDYGQYGTLRPVWAWRLHINIINAIGHYR